MRTGIAGGVLVLCCLVAQGRPGPQDKPGEAVRLKRADLAKLEGDWELKVDTKKGWKGSIRANFVVYPEDSREAGFGRILYHFDLIHGDNKLKVQNSPIGGVPFAGVKRDGKLLLVTDADRRPAPFKVKVVEELSAPFSVADDRLTLDVSKSLKAFCATFTDVDLDWGKLVLVKMKKE
jgi:hypothetical protein